MRTGSRAGLGSLKREDIHDLERCAPAVRVRMLKLFTRLRLSFGNGTKTNTTNLKENGVANH